MDDLYFKMTGTAFDDGYRLDKTVAGMSGLQHVMDGVYKGVTGKTRLTKEALNKSPKSAIIRTSSIT